MTAIQRQELILADDSRKDQLAHDLALQGNPTAATQSSGNNSTRLGNYCICSYRSCYKAFIDSALTSNTLNEVAVLPLNLEMMQTFLQQYTDAIATKAPINSPTFTGTPAAPTASSGTNTTQLATTAFVTTAVAGASVAGISSSADATAITIDSSENVGIGTSNPAGRFHVDGTIKLNGSFPVGSANTVLGVILIALAEYTAIGYEFGSANGIFHCCW